MFDKEQYRQASSLQNTAYINIPFCTSGWIFCPGDEFDYGLFLIVVTFVAYLFPVFLFKFFLFGLF